MKNKKLKHWYYKIYRNHFKQTKRLLPKMNPMLYLHYRLRLNNWSRLLHLKIKTFSLIRDRLLWRKKLCRLRNSLFLKKSQLLRKLVNHRMSLLFHRSLWSSLIKGLNGMLLRFRRPNLKEWLTFSWKLSTTFSKFIKKPRME